MCADGMTNTAVLLLLAWELMQHRVQRLQSVIDVSRSQEIPCSLTFLNSTLIWFARYSDEYLQTWLFDTLHGSVS